MATKYEAKKMTAPEMQPETKEYWKAAEAGKLMIKFCNSCKEYHYYPREICPHCLSDDTVWHEAKGTGTVYTYSVMRRGTPYAIAFVSLDEGPKMMTNLVDCDLDLVHIGQQVKVAFKQSGDVGSPGPYVPCFTPAAEEKDLKKERI